MSIVHSPLHPTTLLGSSPIPGDLSPPTLYPIKYGPLALQLSTWTLDPWEMGQLGSPETSVLKKHTLRNIPEDDRIRINHVGQPEHFFIKTSDYLN